MENIVWCSYSLSNYSFFIKKMNKYDDKKTQQAQNNISLKSLVIENKSAMFYVSAKLTKYFNIKTVMASGLVLMVILPLPMYHLYKLNAELLIVFFVTMSAIFGLFYGTILAIFAESFPKEIRYTGFALTYNIGFGIYGGLLSFLCFYLAKNISDYTAVSIICISAIVGLVELYMFEPIKTKEFTSRVD